MPTLAAIEVLAEPSRRRILDLLRDGERPVGAIVADLAMSQPAVSKHLKVLKDARLVHETRVGRERLYQLDPAPLQRVSGWIEGYRAFWATSLGNLKRHLEER